ncbi:hypothetical protein CO2235_140099 [Cupriavidus oxalaticus]|uniref:Uncharacterized protein n=1 Tax=Cupriavidus oxalaticus TaxID=96344 RepID=A0A976BAA0_9BURK|nr:hypothetical protein CO2235_140099 [Cupriavidus oxalaticus]
MQRIDWTILNQYDFFYAMVGNFAIPGTEYD